MSLAEFMHTPQDFKPSDDWKADFEALNGIHPDLKVCRGVSGLVEGYDDWVYTVEQLEASGIPRYLETAARLRKELSLQPRDEITDGR